MHLRSPTPIMALDFSLIRTWPVGGRDKKSGCARERYGRAERAGKKEGAPMYLHASPPPYSLVLRAFLSENGCGASGSSHFLRVKPWGRGCPPQTPATHTTLKSLGTLHSLGGANIRFQTE